MRPARPFTSYSDYLGIASAFLCLIHCLAGPVFLSASAHLHAESAPASPLLHPIWDYVFLIFGFVAVRYSSQHTPSRFLRTLLWVTYVFLAGSLLMEEASETFRYLVYVSSFALIIVHVINLRNMILTELEKQQEE